MKKSVCALSALVLCVATPAFANDEWFKKIDTNGDGYISKEEHATFSEDMFSKADTNGDGKLSKDEKHASKEKYNHKREKHNSEQRGDMSKDGGTSKESIEK